MGLNKAIRHGKEHRKPYTGSKAIDCTCRNHGTCEYCKANRMRDTLLNDEKFKQMMSEWANDDEDE